MTLAKEKMTMKSALFWTAVVMGLGFLLFWKGPEPLHYAAEPGGHRIEYRVLEEIAFINKSTDDPQRLIERALNRLGDEGWELVTVRTNTYIFKRIRER